MVPLRHLLHVRKSSTSGKDKYGNIIESWGEPREWRVHGYSFPIAEEPYRANRDVIEDELDVYAPDNQEVPGERDRVIVEGVEYTVSGRPKRWTRGPWRHPTAGVTVRLRRSKG